MYIRVFNWFVICFKLKQTLHDTRYSTWYKVRSITLIEQALNCWKIERLRFRTFDPFLNFWKIEKLKNGVLHVMCLLSLRCDCSCWPLRPFSFAVRCAHLSGVLPGVAWSGRDVPGKGRNTLPSGDCGVGLESDRFACYLINSTAVSLADVDERSACCLLTKEVRFVFFRLFLSGGFEKHVWYIRGECFFFASGDRNSVILWFVILKTKVY